MRRKGRGGGGGRMFISSPPPPPQPDPALIYIFLSFRHWQEQNKKLCNESNIKFKGSHLYIVNGPPMHKRVSLDPSIQD